MSGSLTLLPTSLGDVGWQAYLPAETQAAACRLNHFVVENAKTARAELKRIGHPTPLRELAIEAMSLRPSGLLSNVEVCILPHFHCARSAPCALTSSS